MSTAARPTWRLAARRQDELRSLARRSSQVVVAAALVGIATGLGVALFERVVVSGALGALDRAPLWVVALGPLVGLAVAAVALHVVGGGVTPATADEYLMAYHDEAHELGWRGFVGKLTASVATLGTGGAMGLEGPSLFMGATLGARLQARLPRIFRGADRRVLMVAGAAAGVAAIFKAPATGAIFALEVPYQDDVGRRMLLPALVSAALAYVAFVAVNGTEPLFPIVGNPGFDFRDLAGAAALGVAAGLAARIFAAMIRRAKRLSTAHHPLIRVAAGGLSLALLFAVGRVLTGESLVLGPGYSVITWALDPTHGVWLVLAVLVLRCLATVSTVAGGGAGGLFIPLVVGGALTGRAMGGAVHALDTSLFLVVGVAAFLGAGYRVPLAAVMFVAETTGRPGFVVPGLLAAVAAELVMGRSSVTVYQLASNRDAGPEDQSSTGHEGPDEATAKIACNATADHPTIRHREPKEAAMAGITVKSFESPDEVRTPNKTKMEVVDLAGVKAARLTAQPGWRWSECIKPVVGGDACQAHHVGVILSGTMHVVHSDGTERDAGPGDAYVIEPDHDAWVVGDQPVVAFEFDSSTAQSFARPS